MNSISIFRFFIFRSFTEKLLVISVLSVIIAAVFVDNLSKVRASPVTKSITVESISVYDRWIKLYSSQGIVCPDVVFAQNILETGWFTSGVSRAPLSKEGVLIQKGNNNWFGMKRNTRKFGISPRGQECPAQCFDCVHACYKDPSQGILDYAAWQEIRLREYCKFFNRNVPQNSEEYYIFLNNVVIKTKTGFIVARYAEDPKYTQKLKILSKTLKQKFGKVEKN